MTEEMDISPTQHETIPKTHLSSVPEVFEELMGSSYWEQIIKDDRRTRLLSEWLMVAGIAHNYPYNTLEEIIEDYELEEELILRCTAIGETIDEDSDVTLLEIFGEKEYNLRKRKRLNISSLLDLATWCIARLQEDERVKSVAQL